MTRALRGVTVAMFVAASALALVHEGDHGGPVDGPRRVTSGHDAVESFFAGYVDDDGRVVRHDEGGDTVREGQAYAMLLAVAAGDRSRFHRIWSWTKEHLQRPDGLLAWR